MSVPLLVIGALVLAASWSGVPAAITPGPFSAHMIAHMGVVAVAAPLLAAAVAGRAFDPAARAPAWFAPIPASIVELLLVWLWHVPALHHAARTTMTGYLLEQACFLFAGLYLWIAAAGGDGVRGAARGAAGAGGLLFASMHMTLLGALFAVSPRVLYASHTGASLSDQHLGGVIMLLVGGGSYLVGGLWLTRRLLHEGIADAEAAS